MENPMIRPFKNMETSMKSHDAWSQKIPHE
jgi:hypothetical protein